VKGPASNVPGKRKLPEPESIPPKSKFLIFIVQKVRTHHLLHRQARCRIDVQQLQARCLAYRQKPIWSGFDSMETIGEQRSDTFFEIGEKV
jgi:hypothetical protein